MVRLKSRTVDVSSNLLYARKNKFRRYNIDFKGFVGTRQQSYYSVDTYIVRIPGAGAVFELLGKSKQYRSCFVIRWTAQKSCPSVRGSKPWGCNLLFGLRKLSNPPSLLRLPLGPQKEVPMLMSKNGHGAPTRSPRSRTFRSLNGVPWLGGVGF